MPRFKRWACEFGEPPHDEAFACHECSSVCCGYHAERSIEDESWLCPECYRSEVRRALEDDLALLIAPAATGGVVSLDKIVDAVMRRFEAIHA